MVRIALRIGDCDDYEQAIAIARGRDADFDLAILDANLNGQPVSRLPMPSLPDLRREEIRASRRHPPAAEFAMLWPHDASLNQRSRYARHL